MDFKKIEKMAKEDWEREKEFLGAWKKSLDKFNYENEEGTSGEIDQIVEFLCDNYNKHEGFYTEIELVNKITTTIDKHKRYEYLRGYLIASKDFNQKFRASDFVNEETKKILEENKKLKRENEILRSAIKIVKEVK